MPGKKRSTTEAPSVEEAGAVLRTALAERDDAQWSLNVAGMQQELLDQQLRLAQQQYQNAGRERDEEERFVATHQAILEEKQQLFLSATSDLRAIEKQHADARLQLTTVETRLNAARNAVTSARQALQDAADAAVADESGEHAVLTEA